MILPHEYMVALDTLPSFITMEQAAWVCNSAEFYPTLQNRIPMHASPKHLVWIEPQVGEQLPIANNIDKLIVIASRPMARLLPERHALVDSPMGLQPGGNLRLKKQLRAGGWRVSEKYYVHTIKSIILNLIGERLDRSERPNQADQWQFAARQQYVSRRPTLATVGMWVCTRV